MKKHRSVRTALVLSLAVGALALPAAHTCAATYYWDGNNNTGGFGSASGTWAAPTSGTLTSGWSTNSGGTAAINGNSVTTTTSDLVNFGNGTTGLGAGTINVSGTVNVNDVIFASGSGAINLTGGTIRLGGTTPSITAQNTGNVVDSAITLLTHSSISFSRNVNATGTLTIDGQISGNFNLTFTTPNVASNNNNQVVLLGSANTYSGTTLIDTGNINNTTTIRAGVDDALPTTTVLTLDGGNGAGTGRTVTYDLNSNNQTIAGLTNVTGLTLRNQRIANTGGLAATLTINNTATFTFSGDINGTNLSLTKTGAGTQILSGTNGYTGATNVNNGILAIDHTGALNGTTAINLGTTTGGTLRFDVDGVAINDPVTVANTGVTSTFSSNNSLGGGIVTNTDLNGVISGNGNVAFVTGSNLGNPYSTFTLNAANDYLGSTTVNAAGGTNTNVFIELGIENALPSTTVLMFGNTAGAGSGRQHTVDLNGFNQTLAGVQSSVGSGRTQRIHNTSGTFATLTINDDGNRTFTGVLGTAAGDNFGVVKNGTGTWTLVGQSVTAINSYTGGTVLNQGGITLGANATLGTGPLQVNNTNSTAAGTNVLLTLPTGADLTVGALSGTIATPTSGTNTATIQTQTGRTFTVNQTVNGIFEGVIAGSGNFTLGSLSTDTLALYGDNTYTGTTTVNGGVLHLAGGALDNGTIDVQSGEFRQTAGMNNVTAAGPGTHLNVAPGATYTLDGGTLNFGDTDSSTQTLPPGGDGNGASTMLFAGTFNFDDGILMNVTNIDPGPFGPGGLFTQDGGTFVIGVDGVSDTANAVRAITNIDGDFQQSAGILKIDIFGADNTYAAGEVGNFPAILQTDSDLLDVTGDLVLSGTLAINTNGVQPPAFGWYDAAYANTITLGSGFNLTGVGLYQVIDNPNGGQILQVAAPEPAGILAWLFVSVIGFRAWRQFARRK